MLHMLPPELAHAIALSALQYGVAGLLPRPNAPAALAQNYGGLTFAHPLGLAAGFDKNAQAVLPLLRLGFSFVEAGTVTPKPQAGNPKPRLFRLPELAALINRLGFNNDGLASFIPNMLLAKESAMRQNKPIIMGANIGANRDSDNRLADYVLAAKAVAPYASYITINVSSPNTPGLRLLQQAAELAPLLAGVTTALAEQPKKPPILLKIAPDIEPEALADIIALAKEHGLLGLIISNTTMSRPPGVSAKLAAEAGGLSGAPLFSLSTHILKTAFMLKQKLNAPELLLVGVGGIMTGADAVAKMRAGANLIQIYTGLVYRGPVLIAEIIEALTQALEKAGTQNIADIIGTDARISA